MVIAGASEQVRRYVRLGPSPRGAQALCLAGRVVALMAGRYTPAIDDIREIALPALRQLERLSLVHLDAVISGLVGQRAGPYGLRGLEFADYRPYTPGDDLRRIDWNIYARLREVFVKVAPGEAHVGLCLLLDGSASMVAGEPSKLGYAQRLAAMLGAIALLRSDVAQVQMLADGEAWAGATLTSPRLVAGLIAEIAGMLRGTRTFEAARRAELVAL